MNASEPQSSKPAWFALVDSDAPSAQVVKVNKKLPMIALIVTGAIAASGTFFANASDKSQSATNSIPSVTTTAVSDVVDATSNPVATPAQQNSKSHSTVNVSSHPAPKPASTKAALQNPAQGGLQAPRGGGDDDDDDEDEDHEGREGHEREERH